MRVNTELDKFYFVLKERTMLRLNLKKEQGWDCKKTVRVYHLLKPLFLNLVKGSLLSLKQIIILVVAIRSVEYKTVTLYRQDDTSWRTQGRGNQNVVDQSS